MGWIYIPAGWLLSIRQSPIDIVSLDANALSQRSAQQTGMEKAGVLMSCRRLPVPGILPWSCLLWEPMLNWESSCIAWTGTVDAGRGELGGTPELCCEG